jgi:hypothetical protein
MLDSQPRLLQPVVLVKVSLKKYLRTLSDFLVLNGVSTSMLLCILLASFHCLRAILQSNTVVSKALEQADVDPAPTSRDQRFLPLRLAISLRQWLADDTCVLAQDLDQCRTRKASIPWQEVSFVPLLRSEPGKQRRPLQIPW